MDLQHHHNNYITPPHMGMSPVCGVHPHVKGCCAIIVPVKCRNQTPLFYYKIDSNAFQHLEPQT
jgi:hypothetical protein